jgi:hypothetical protein
VFGNDDHSLTASMKGGLVFSDRFVFRLLLVVLQDTTNTVLVPSSGKAVSFH